MDKSTYTKAKDIICEIFKIKNLQDYQDECLENLVAGKDCFICQPTGSGKSIIFQALPFFKYALELLESTATNVSPSNVLQGCKYTVIVVSPLISLMKDQMKYLQSIGIKACCINHDEETQLSQEEIKENNIIFTSPESIVNTYRNIFKDSKFGKRVVSIAIDESHCIKKWGSSSKQADAFRSSYNNLAELRSLMYCKVPMVSLTATATKATKSFIIENLCMHQPCDISSTPEKKNIKFNVITIKDRDPEVLLNPLIDDIKENEYQATKVLIFCRIMRDVRAIYSLFERNLKDRFPDYISRPYGMFHSKTEEKIKEHIINEFTDRDGKVRILISTIAFGMGVNCQGLYTILHYGPPAGLDDYFQEAGRGGRDGLQCNAVLINYPKSLQSPNISANVKEYAKNVSICRRSLILREFGEAACSFISPIHNCCDLCEKKCMCNGDSCRIKNRINWWNRVVIFENQKKNKISKKKLPIATRIRLQTELEVLQTKLPKLTGHSGSDLLSGFPEESITQIIDIADIAITEEVILEKTAVFNTDLLPSIVQIVRNVCKEDPSF